MPLVLIVLLAAFLRLQHVGLPLGDAHRWRQTFNADVARQFVQGTFDPFHPRVNWGGPDGVVAMEFPLFPAILAVLYLTFGESPEAGRGLTVAFSLGTVVLVYLVGCRLAGRGAGRAAAFVFAVSPSAVFFGRAVMVDVPMLFFSAGAVLGYLRYYDTGARRALVLGAASLALAGLVKLPNILVLGPVVYLGWAVHGFRVLRDRAWHASLAAALACVAAWYWYADVTFHRTGLGVAAFHPAGTYGPEVSIASGPMTLVSSWSTMDRLRDPDFRTVIVDRLWDLHLTPLGFGLAVVGLALAARSWRLSGVLVWLAAVLSFILATAEGNYWHDYHQLPILLPAALLAGLAAAPAFAPFADAAWLRGLPPLRARLVAAAAAAAIAGVGLLAFYRSNVIDSHFRPGGLDWGRMDAGRAIAGATPADALLVVVEYERFGNNSPTLLYYANRLGWALDLDSLTAHSLVQLRRSGARYFATTVWAELAAKHPDVVNYLTASGEVPLSGAPAGTRLFRIR